MKCVNIFLCNQKRNFGWKWEISPYTPIVKFAHFGNVMSVDMALPKWAMFTMGVYGKSPCLLYDPAEILLLVTKNVYAYYENFSSKKQAIKKVSPKCVWQTYMKWTVEYLFEHPSTISAKCHWYTSLTVDVVRDLNALSQNDTPFPALMCS